MWGLVTVAGVAVLVLLGGAAAFLCQRRMRRVRLQRAKDLFHRRREWLEADFLSRASASGKPRSLLWEDCAFEDTIALARSPIGPVAGAGRSHHHLRVDRRTRRGSFWCGRLSPSCHGRVPVRWNAVDDGRPRSVQSQSHRDHPPLRARAGTRGVASPAQVPTLYFINFRSTVCRMPPLR